MGHLLYIEWLKIKNYRTFWILFTLFVISMFGICSLWWYFDVYTKESGDMAMQAAGSFIFGSFRFPGVFNTLTQISSWLLYFPGFIIIFLTTNEYTYRTHRQNIIDGIDRKDFIKAKILLAFLLALLCTLIVSICAVIFGLMSGSGYYTNDILISVFYFFIQSCIYILFALFLALLVRRSALAIGIYFIYGILLDYLIAMAISKYTNSTIGFYLMPLQVSDQLLPNKISSKFLEMLGNFKTSIALIISIAWIVFYCIFPVKKFQKEDL